MAERLREAVVRLGQRDGREIEASREREQKRKDGAGGYRRDSLSSASAPLPLGIVIGFRCTSRFSVLSRLTVLHTLTLQFCIQYIARFAIN